ncbi:hypothetical protein AB0F17_59510 [Nonomuraea sp. NPDC026600]|uniref:hypothetical protein n=1 Tax=Nonomuraea sp. NPDC026600 TaxID=3155363 RepID=UPI0033C61764
MTEDAAEMSAAFAVFGRVERMLTREGWRPSEVERALAVRLHDAVGVAVRLEWDQRQRGETDYGAIPIAEPLRDVVRQEAAGPLPDMTEALAEWADARATVAPITERRRVLMVYSQILAAMIREDYTS